VNAIKDLLALPAEKKLSEQLRVAVKLGDGDRQDELQMQLKDLFFERTGAALFDLSKYPRLRSIDDFSNAKMMGKQERRDTFLKHTTKPIPISLTQLDKGLREDALLTFKNLLGYMGETIASFPLMLVQELLGLVLTGGSPDALAPIQTEVYVQLIKQLTDNPSPKSERLGWQLMALFLQCFPPDSMVENYVEFFVRTKTADAHARELITIMYKRMRKGALRKVPAEDQLATMLLAADVDSYPRVSMAEEARPPHPGDLHSTGRQVSGLI